MKKQIPNLITLGNLLCGILATMFAVGGLLNYAALFIFLGIFLDFFDGMTARLLDVSSPMGKELDSLADVVTSGVAPGFILYCILQDSPCEWLKTVALAIPLFAAYRLAKFNIDSRQSHSFLGLPTPANAMVWAALGILFFRTNHQTLGIAGIDASFLFTDTSLIILAVVSLLLDIAMIAEFPLFALKFKKFGWKENQLRYLFLLTCIILIVLLGELGIALCILWYILLSLLTQKKQHAE